MGGQQDAALAFSQEREPVPVVGHKVYPIMCKNKFVPVHAIKAYGGVQL
jgi:hypothetical protein